MRPLLVGASCLVAAAIAGAARLEAHEMGSTRVAVMLHDDRRYEIDVVTDAASLLEKLETAGEPRASAAFAGVLPPAEAAERLAALDGVFRSRLIVAFDRVGARPAIEYVVAPATDMGAPVATIRLTGTIPGSAHEFAWAYFWTFTSYALSVQTSAGGDPFVESLEAGQTSTPFSLSGLTRSPFMTRWHGYAFPVFVIALSSFVAWCAWPHSRLSADAAYTRDAQSRAVQHAERGDRLFEAGKIDDAAVEYHRANQATPNHPGARRGLARVAAAQGHYTRALELYRALLEESPSADVAAAVGEILRRGGDTRGAEEMYARAETLTRK